MDKVDVRVGWTGADYGVVVTSVEDCTTPGAHMKAKTVFLTSEDAATVAGQLLRHAAMADSMNGKQ